MSELKKINIQLPRDLKLLETFYETLMKPNFPLENELEPLEVWIEKLSGDQTKATHELHVVLALDPKDSKIVGGICYEYYAQSNCILITYLVIDSSTRNQGVSLFLALSAWQGMQAAATRRGYAQPNAIFCEVNDPAKIKDEQDSVSPIARLRAFQQMGVRTLEKFNYVQPALHGRADKGRDMLLGIVVGPMLPREKGKLYIPSQHVKQFITDFYQELAGPDYKNDVDYKAMVKDLESRDKVFIVDFDLSRFQKAKKNIPKKPTASLVPVHVVVVGAGLSGLACARELTKHGFSVTVLEGRHRLGGRLYTGRSFDTRLEVGAAWLHGTEGSTLAAFMNKHLPQMEYYKSDEQSLALIDEDGKQIPTAVIFECYLKFLNLLEAVAAKYGSKNDTMQQEIEEENRKLQQVKQNSDVSDIDNAAYENLLINQCQKTTTQAIQNLKKIQGKRCFVSLQQAVEEVYQANKQFHYQNKHEKQVYNYLFSNLESLQNATMKELNACDYDYGMLLEGGDQMVLSGFNRVVSALASGIKIHTDTEVVKIDYSNSKKQNKQAPKVKVYTKDGHVFDCDAVVVTCPIGVLKNSLEDKEQHKKPTKPKFTASHFSCDEVSSYPAVRFEPALPAWKQTAISNIGVGHFNKVILRFPYKFWLDFDYVGFNLPRDLCKEERNNLQKATNKRENMWLINAHAPTKGEPILVCLISGDFAREAETLNDEEITKIVMNKLRFIYEKNPENIVLSPSAPSSKFSSEPPASITTIPDPIDVIITRWVSDPYSQCSYSFLPVGCTIQDFDAMAASVDDVVFFAGEHTSRHRFGYADGAFASGLREAKRIMELYKDLLVAIRSKL